MKIIICGSMTASPEMVAAKQALEALGHAVVLPEFTEEYAALDTIDKMHTESARNKVEYDLLKIGLSSNRDYLYARTDSRIDEWLATGFIQEVEDLITVITFYPAKRSRYEH